MKHINKLKLGAFAAFLALAPISSAIAQNIDPVNGQPAASGMNSLNQQSSSPFNYHIVNPNLDVDPNTYSPSVMPPSGLDIDPDSSHNFNTVPRYGNTTNTTTNTPGYNDPSGFANDPNSRYRHDAPEIGGNNNINMMNNDQTRNTHLGSPNNTQRQGTTNF